MAPVNNELLCTDITDVLMYTAVVSQCGVLPKLCDTMFRGEPLMPQRHLKRDK